MERIFQEYVMEAKKAGKSVLLSSHILSEVERLCDRIGIIREGKIIETGYITRVTSLNKNTFTCRDESNRLTLDDRKR